jgi:hypothetical protein
VFEIKPIAAETIPRAMQKAERYRLLNEPSEAESICLDVLELQPDNQDALRCLLLSLTDQFGTGSRQVVDQAKQLLPRLSGYEQKYYAGIIAERFARYHLHLGHPGAKMAAYDHLRDAMEFYAEADALAPEGNDDAILRHNTCVRMIRWNRLTAPSMIDELEQPLE